MGQLILTDETTPSTPAAGRGTVYFDSADNGRMKAVRPDGQVYVMNMSGFDKNLLINGGLDFWQRVNPTVATSVGGSSTAKAYGPDRWCFTAETVNFTVQRVDTNTAPETGLQARMYCRGIKITNAGKVFMAQCIEGHATMPLRNRKVRFQVKMKRAVAAAMNVRITLLQLTSAGTIDVMPNPFTASLAGASGTDATLGTNLSYIAPDAGSAINGTIVGNGVTCALSASWVNYSGVWTVPSNLKNLVAVIFSDADLAISDELHVAEAGVYDGPDVIDWVPMPYQLDLDRCQRFYEKSFLLDTLPAQNVGVNTAERRIVQAVGAAAAGCPLFIDYRTEKRGVPAVTFFNPAAANALIRNVTVNADTTVNTTVGSTARNVYLTATSAAGSAAGNVNSLHFTADAEI